MHLVHNIHPCYTAIFWTKLYLGDKEDIYIYIYVSINLHINYIWTLQCHGHKVRLADKKTGGIMKVHCIQIASVLFLEYTISTLKWSILITNKKLK